MGMFEALLAAPSYQLALEGFLFLYVLWIVFKKSYQPEPMELTEVRELTEQVSSQ